MIKKINDNLLSTIYIMHQNIQKLLQRGETITDLEEASDHLLTSSQSFVMEVLPWYKRCPFYVSFYFWNCPCLRKSHNPEELVQHIPFHPLIEE